MLWNTILLLVTAMAASGADADELYYLSDAFIEEVNALATTWKAGRNFPKNTSEKFMKRLSCAWTNSTVKFEKKPFGEIGVDLPDSFDARTKWPSCHSLNEIRNQGHCGSCWAISVASVISDRECIQKGVQFHASSEDLVSCCPECGHGCHGGVPGEAFLHYTTRGVVSGGSYLVSDGCKPYSEDEYEDGKAPVCVKKCSDPRYPVSYVDDLHRGTKAYLISGEEQMKHELYTNGPVTVSIDAYQDFHDYTTGVYHHTKGEFQGGHALKVIGWGVENDTPYWLIANSWGPSWGQNGYVKFLRGSDDCGIESKQVVTAMAI